MARQENSQQPLSWSELKEELSKLVVDEIELELRSLTSNELLFVKFDESNDVIGPFEKGDLKAALPDQEEITHNLSACSADEIELEQWRPLMENPFFQRRKPQLMSTGALESVNDNEFYVLRDGQKFGPLELHELKELVNHREILATDLISIDNGETFGKLYEWEEFDRRNFKNQTLPQRPNEDFLTLGNIEVLKNFKDKSQTHGEAEAMANLAFVGNVRNGKVLEWNPQSSSRLHAQDDGVTGKDNELADTTTQTMSSYFYAMVFAVSTIGILYMGLTWQAPHEETISRGPASIREVELENSPQNSMKPMTLTPIEKIPSEQVQEVRELSKTKIRPLKPSRKSFRDSNSFKKALSDNPVIEDSELRFDDGTGAMERDPVRAQVSKETFDPELSPSEEALADEPYPEELSPEETLSPRPFRRPASTGRTWVDDASGTDESYDDAPAESDYYESEPLD